MGNSFNMRIEHRNLTSTLMLLFLSDVLCNEGNVVYQQQHICAVKGSSVVIPCSVYFPGQCIIKSVIWGHIIYDTFKVPFIFESKSRNNSSKFQYIGDKHHNCSLKIHHVEHNDGGKYAFRFITDSEQGKWIALRGSTLKVVDLNVSVKKPHGNEMMKEGESVNLICINSCDGINVSSAFTWFKNGEPINEGPVLYLSNMSSTSSGNYTCSLKTHTGTTSGVININVEYGPKNTSVSIRPSTEVDVGSNVTLICCSHANPPVENYTWFKIYDNDDIIDVGHQPELHFREFYPGDGGQYLCSATNKHGSQNSSVVMLKMKVSGSTITRDALIIATIAVLLIVTSVIAIIRKWKAAPKTECEEDIQNAVYVNWSIFHNNQSQEGNQFEGETVEPIYTAVNFTTIRKSNMEQQMDSHTDEGVIYSRVRRDQLLNPSYIETL